MIRRMFRQVLTRGGEVLLAVGLVMVFFLLFMGLLSLTFPTGTNLADLMRTETVAARPAPRPPRGVDLVVPDEPTAEPTAGETGGPIAVLSRVHRNVKDKPADAIAWSDSRSGLPLENHHAVQTYERSGATISFGESSEMVLGENSLVILKSAEGQSSDDGRRASLIVLDGTLRGRIDVGPGGSGSVEINAGTASARLRPDTKSGRPGEFTVTVNDDHSSTFSVFTGSAEVVTGSGPTAVATNHSVTIDARGIAGAVVPLPPAPEPIAPRQGWSQRYHTTRTRVGFRWSAGGTAAGYRLIVARDPGFEDVVASERVEEPGFTLGNLRAGRYYWRVRGVRGEVEGPDSPTREFLVVLDSKPPDLVVRFPDNVVREREVRLSGTTRPGTKVFIGAERVPVSGTGGFAHTLSLKRGINVVVVEAVDDTGNVAYSSHVINANY